MEGWKNRRTPVLFWRHEPPTSRARSYSAGQTDLQSDTNEHELKLWQQYGFATCFVEQLNTMILQISHCEVTIPSVCLLVTQSRVADTRLRNKGTVQSVSHMDKTLIRMKINLQTKGRNVVPICKIGQGHSLD